MNLSWKDLIGTVGTALIVYIAYAANKGMDLPIIASTRGSYIAIGIIGLATCAFAARMNNGFDSPALIVSAVLGGISLVLIIIGIISSNKVLLIPLASVTVLLWIISTIRHIAMK